MSLGGTVEDQLFSPGGISSTTPLDSAESAPSTPSVSSSVAEPGVSSESGEGAAQAAVQDGPVGGVVGQFTGVLTSFTTATQVTPSIAPSSASTPSSERVAESSTRLAISEPSATSAIPSSKASASSALPSDLTSVSQEPVSEASQVSIFSVNEASTTTDEFASLITNPVLPSQPSAILMTSDGVPTSSLLRSSMSPLAMNAPSAPADLAQANDAVDQGSNIFVPNNRLFPLGIASVAVGGLVVIAAVLFILVRCCGWNRKRRLRDSVPSFVDTERSDRNTMFEPKFETITTNLEVDAPASTRPRGTDTTGAPTRPPRPAPPRPARSEQRGYQDIPPTRNLLNPFNDPSSRVIGYPGMDSGRYDDDRYPGLPRGAQSNTVKYPDQRDLQRGYAALGYGSTDQVPPTNNASAYGGAYFSPGELVPPVNPFSAFPPRRGALGVPRDVQSNGTLGSPVPSFNTGRLGYLSNDPTPDHANRTNTSNLIITNDVDGDTGANGGYAKNAKLYEATTDKRPISIFARDLTRSNSIASSRSGTSVGSSILTSFERVDPREYPDIPSQGFIVPSRGNANIDFGQQGYARTRPKRNSGDSEMSDTSAYSQATGVTRNMSGKSKKLAKPRAWGSDAV